MTTAALMEQARRIRRVRTRRGARARRGLIGHVRRLDIILGRSYEQLRRDVKASLRGRPDDVASGRLAQDDEDEETVDRDRIGALLVILALWRQRHQRLADEGAGLLFQIGRRYALQQTDRTAAQPSHETAQLRVGVLDQYRGDMDRLQNGLAEGTYRASGLRQILEKGDSVSSALREVDQLFDAERFRIDLFTESLVWTAWSEGFRAGAVDGTQDAIAAGETPLRYEWKGPADELTCGPCLGQFGRPVQANSLSDIPLPQSICAYGRNCRHWWNVVN